MAEVAIVPEPSRGSAGDARSWARAATAWAVNYRTEPEPARELCTRSRPTASGIAVYADVGRADESRRCRHRWMRVGPDRAVNNRHDRAEHAGGDLDPPTLERLLEVNV